MGGRANKAQEYSYELCRAMCRGAIRETLSILENHPDAQLVAAVVLIDRQEKLQDSALSAIQALERDYGLSILPAIP